MHGGGPAAGGRGRARRLGARLLLLLVWGLALGLSTPAEAAADSPRVLRADSLAVVFWPGHRPLALRTLRAARAPLPLPGLPQGDVRIAGTIYLAPTPALFDSLTGGRIPSWAAGVAIPGLRRIVLPTYAAPGGIGDAVVTLRHELAHLALSAHLPDGIPRWFNEGYATWVSGGWDESSGWQIRLAFLRGRAPPLDSLALGWPRQAADARLAYLLSASAVRHLATRGGPAGFEALMARWRETGDLDAAMRSTYQLTLGMFEREWREMVRNRYGWLLALSQAGVFWLVVVLLVILLGSGRRKRNQLRMREMEKEERMLPPPIDSDIEYPLEHGVDDELTRG